MTSWRAALRPLTRVPTACPLRAAQTLLGMLTLAALAGPAIASLAFDEPPSTPEGNWLAWWLFSTRRVFVLLGSVGVLALVAGCTLGAVVAHGPAVLGPGLVRLLEVSGALPSLVLVALWRLYSPQGGLLEFALVLSVLKSIETARLVQEETERIRWRGFVLAARALGASRLRIFLRHVLPQLTPLLARNSAVTAASIVGIEAGLSFIGLGLPGVATWGGHLAQAIQRTPVLTTATVVALLSVVSTILALHTVAEHLDQTDPPA